MQSQRSSMKPLLVAGAIGVTLSLLVSNVVQKEMDGKLIKGGKPAPSFDLAGVDGRPVALSDVLSKRKAVLVNFWFAACPPCQGEMPYLEQAYQRYKARGLDIVAINTQDDVATARRYVRDKKLSFRFALDDGRTSAAYGVASTPTSYLLDEKGRIVWRASGFDGDGTELKKALAQLGFS